MKNKKFTLTILGFLISIFGFSQNPNQVEMADVMRDNGKIYVVVGVLLILFFGFLSYLILLDKKVSKLEKEFNQSPK